MSFQEGRKLNVLLVNPTFVLYKHGWPPLGLAYLAAALEKAGHKARIYDPTPNYQSPALIPPDFPPDLVGISVVTPLRTASLMLAERMKKETGLPIVVGGPDVTTSYEVFMDSPYIDYAIMGEGEVTLVELADAIANGGSFETIDGLAFKEDGSVRVNEPRELLNNIDEVPIPARHLLDMTWYRRSILLRGTQHPATSIMSARGCPHTCMFCDSRRTWTRRYRPHSVGRVVDEIVDILRKYRVKNFQFLDDTFMANRKRTFDLCEAFSKHLKGIQWVCQGRVDILDDEIVEAMREAGCIQIEFGVESGSDEVLKTLRKGFTRSQVVETFELCRRHGVRTYANLMLGAPHETEADVRATFDLYREIRPNAADLWITTAYPGTDLYEYCVENNLLHEDYAVDLLHHGHELGSVHFIKGELSQKDILALRNEFYNEVRKDWDF